MDAIANNDFLVSSLLWPEVSRTIHLDDIHRDSSPTMSPLKWYIRPRVINQNGGAAVMSVGLVGVTVLSK